MEKMLCYRRNKQINERGVDNTLLLVNPQTDTIFQLNEFGVAIWQLLASPIAIDEIITTFTVAFPDASKEQITRDVEKLFQQMIERKLILRANCQESG